MSIKIPLKLSDGKTIRTIEELREHFNLADVLSYYSSGRLAKWLSDGYYDKEAEKVNALDPLSENFRKDLCNILGVDYQEYGNLDLEDISKRKERLERLKQYTADDEILAAVDSVAFTQEELEDLLNKADLLVKDDDDNPVIYLCGKHFSIPAHIGGIIYKGINNPTVTFDGGIVEAGIDLQDLEFDIGSYVEDDYNKFSDAFDESSILGMKLLRIAAEKGSAAVQFILGKCYYNGFGIEKDYEEAVKWYKKSAEQDNSEAAYELGKCYGNRYGVELNLEEAVKWYRKSAEHGNSEAAYELGKCYENGYGVEKNLEEAIKWYKKLPCFRVERKFLGYREVDIEQTQKEAEQGNSDAQCRLGLCYANDIGVKEDAIEAVKWYKKSAEQDNSEAAYELGKCYENGYGVEKNLEEAVKWYRKSAEQGISYVWRGLANVMSEARKLFFRRGSIT